MSERMDITVVIPTIPPRADLFRRAVASCYAQTLPPVEIVAVTDRDRRGAAWTRNEALKRATTPWVAFLDDDDVLEPQHLETLAHAAADSPSVDYWFPWFTVADAAGQRHLDWDPLGHFGKVFDPASPHQTTITTMVRRELAQAVGFAAPTSDVPPGKDGETLNSGEDWSFTLGCIEAGATIVHVPERTWLWYHHGQNTSGLPDRW